MVMSAVERRIGVFDTGIASDNLGDLIIMDAVWNAIAEIFGRSAQTERIATHTPIPARAYGKLAKLEFAIVGGTNILKSHMFVRANWRLRLYDMFLLKNVVLLGVGWQQYQKRSTDFLSRLLFSRILSKQFVHSVRDQYTLEKMHPQLKNVAYTACPTLWSLTAQKCAQVPTRKGDKAIVSLTYYRPDAADAGLIQLLKQRYQTVYFWCQQERDRQYLNSLGCADGITPIDDIDSYDRILASENVDVVGTRLHGGIRALQHGRRALILAVDNRAVEMARTTDLPVIDRHDLATIDGWIDQSPTVSLSLPWDAISAWKGQFAKAA